MADRVLACGQIKRAIGVSLAANAKSTGLSWRRNVRLPGLTKPHYVADLAIYADGSLHAVVEVAAPSSTWSLHGKLDDISAAGVPNVWLIMTKRSLIQKFQDGSLLATEAIEFPERGFRLTAQEIFA